MKNLELKNLGVQEMNVAEMTKVEGGGLLNDILTGVVGTVNAVAADASVFLNKTLTNVLKFVWSL